MASGVEELLDILYEMIDEAKGVPLSSDKCMVERDRALDLLDDIRAPVSYTHLDVYKRQKYAFAFWT